jgi:transposase
MTDETGYGVLTDAQWADLAPLIEQCRPPHKTEHKNLRRTIEAIVWRHESGAKWRSIPPHLGPWWMAAQTFIRWSQHGTWERLLELAQQGKGITLGKADQRFHRTTFDGKVRRGMVFLDGSTIRAHQKAAGAAKKGASSAQRDKREALGRSRGKASVIVDGSGRAVGFALAPGQANELPMAPVLLRFLTAVALWIVADRGYSSQALRMLIWGLGSRPAIPTRRNEASVACPPWIYTNRNLVERFWSRVKEWRAVATRYEKTERSFMGVLCMAATMDWLKA